MNTSTIIAIILAFLLFITIIIIIVLVVLYMRKSSGSMPIYDYPETTKSYYMYDPLFDKYYSFKDKVYYISDNLELATPFTFETTGTTGSYKIKTNGDYMLVNNSGFSGVSFSSASIIKILPMKHWEANAYNFPCMSVEVEGTNFPSTFVFSGIPLIYLYESTMKSRIDPALPDQMKSSNPIGATGIYKLNVFPSSNYLAGSTSVIVNSTGITFSIYSTSLFNGEIVNREMETSGASGISYIPYTTGNIEITFIFPLSLYYISFDDGGIKLVNNDGTYMTLPTNYTNDIAKKIGLFKLIKQ